MQIDYSITANSLKPKLSEFWKLSKNKINLISNEYDESKGSPVFTVNGKYTTRGWTEWTQGFQYGIQILTAEGLNDPELYELGKSNTKNKMAHHLSHFGVHDHGFNNLSTYGNLLRLSNEGQFKLNEDEKSFYKLALSLSGSVQAKRWSSVKDGGYIYSFNGPHSLFIDTIRTVRILVASHLLNHRMLDENDVQIDLLERAIIHAKTTAKYGVFYGEGRDSYDISGRVAHESIFNLNDGNYRCPNSQQGFSGFTTWTRGLAWAITGYAEFLEFLNDYQGHLESKEEIVGIFKKAAISTCEFYLDHTAADGIPYWDTGAPKIANLGDYQNRISEPINDFEPIDSSAAAIAAQGLIRLGKALESSDKKASERFSQAGLTVLNTLLSEPYLSKDEKHQGIILHSIYHQPNGWDHKPEQNKAPYGESSMWGDYHMAELCLLVDKMSQGKYYKYYDGLL